MNWNRESPDPQCGPQSPRTGQDVESHLKVKPLHGNGLVDSGGGTRTPDTRIMIPLL